MRVLLDSCIWPGVKEELARAGHQVEWVGDWESDPGGAELARGAIVTAEPSRVRVRTSS